MSDDKQGLIPAVGKKSKDRGSSILGAGKKRKIDWVIVGLVGFGLCVAIAAITFLTSDRKANNGIVADNAIDETTLPKDFDNNNNLDSLMAQISKESQQKAMNSEDKPNQDEIKKPNVEVKKATISKPVELPPPLPNVEKQTTVSTSQKNNVNPTLERKLNSSVMVNFESQEQPGSAEQQNNTLDTQPFAEGYASTKYRLVRDYLLRHGTNIPCTLITKVVSTYSGLTLCSVTRDIYSANGRTLLIEKGSQVSGVQNVSLAQGQARVFVKWSDIETPTGVNVRIDSLGTGQLGASGVDAWVDTHFKERFGGAILLSFLDDAFATLANSQLKNSQISTENTQNMASDMASKALENSINIPPTGYLNIGTKLNILVARDIDMSNVYKLERTK